MATQTIDATLFASSHPDIAKRTSISGLFNFLCNVTDWYFIFCFYFRTGR